MSGVARWVDPNNTIQSGSGYKNNLDAAHAVAKRIADRFAAHQVYSSSPQPDLAVEVDAGYIWAGSTLLEIAAQTVTGFTTPAAGYLRIDRVVIDKSTGAAVRLAGVAQTIGSPTAVPPAIPAGYEPCCQVSFTSSSTVVTDSMITEERTLGVQRQIAAIASGRNIAARTNASTPNSKLDITADELVLKDANGVPFFASSVSITSDMAASGANGLDTGAEASGTWYYHWAIAKPDGTLAGLISASATAPTMPAGYVYKALVSAARNDGSSNFLPYRQVGSWVYFDNAQTVLASGTATTETSVSTAAAVPPIATQTLLHGRGGHGDATDAITAVTLRHISGSDSDYIYFDRSITGGGTIDTYNSSSTFLFPNISQNLYYLWSAARTAREFILQVKGFVLPLGGQ